MLRFSKWFLIPVLALAPLYLSGCLSGFPAVGHSAVSTPTTVLRVAAVSTTPASPTAAVAPPPTFTPTATPTAEPTATTTPSPIPSPVVTSTLAPTPLSLRSRQETFEKIWQTVDENYLYDDFRGLDWDAVWIEFAPRVRAAQSNTEFYLLMTEMVDRLQDQHSRFLAPGDAAAESVQSTGQERHVGIGVITTPSEDGIIIQHVFSDSPAAQAGLRTRDRIIAIDGTAFAAGKDIHGRAGTEVRLTVARPDEQPREVVLTRQEVEGHIAPLVRRLPGDIGYLGVTTLWIHDMDDQVSGALTDLVVEHPLKGLILDLRGNPGGWRDVLTSVLGHFVQGNVGVFYDRQRTRPLIIHETSGPDLRDLPLVVLIDQNTASYAELLAAILQVEANAFIIGAPSSGNTETIYAYEMEDGARLWVAQEGFRLRNGVNLEGEGVQPDMIIDVDWTRYSEQRDPHILAALHHLQKP